MHTSGNLTGHFGMKLFMESIWTKRAKFACRRSLNSRTDASPNRVPVIRIPRSVELHLSWGTLVFQALKQLDARRALFVEEMLRGFVLADKDLYLYQVKGESRVRIVPTGRGKRLYGMPFGSI